MSCRTATSRLPVEHLPMAIVYPLLERIPA